MPDNESMLEKEKTMDIVTENKLVPTKPWFSKSDLLKPENESLEKNPKSMSSVSSKNSSSQKNHPSFHPVIYMILHSTKMPILHYKGVYRQVILFVADLCAQELLKIKSVSQVLVNLSIINVFVNKKYGTECFY